MTPFVWSFTAIQAFTDYPDDFYRRFVLGEKPVMSPAMQKGIEVHKACEDFMKGQKALIDPIYYPLLKRIYDAAQGKKIFVEQRQQLLMNVSVIDENLMVRPEDKDEVDQANADIEQSMRMQLKNRESVTLRSINEALKKIDEGKYGECETCGEPIEFRRLQARPTATLCIACKEEEEKANASAVLGHKFHYVH